VQQSRQRDSHRRIDIAITKAAQAGHIEELVGGGERVTVLR